MKQITYLFLILAATLISACGFDDETPVGPVFTISPTFELINQTAEFSMLSRALNRSGLDSALVQANVFTIFAPTNAAWTASGIDVETIDSTELNNLLRYHLILNIGLPNNLIQEGQLYLTTGNIQSPDGSSVMMFLERTSSEITLNNEASFVGDEKIGTNAIIHSIDAVLQPPTMMDLLEGNPDLSRLAGLFNDAAALDDGTALADSLRRPGPFTVFAAADNTFPSDLTLTPEQMRAVALYHVVSARNFRFEDFPSSFTTLEGDAVNIFNRSVITSSAQSLDLVFENIQGTNGTMHLVSELMLPEGI
jgi:transforming growth factor-beta-induced protein